MCYIAQASSKFKGNNCQLFRESSSYTLVSLGILQTSDPIADLQHHSACRQIKLIKKVDPGGWGRAFCRTYTGKSGSDLVSMQGSKLVAWKKIIYKLVFNFFWNVVMKSYLLSFPHANPIAQHQKWKGKRIRRITRLTPRISMRCFPFSQLHPTLSGQNLQVSNHLNTEKVHIKYHSKGEESWLVPSFLFCYSNQWNKGIEV